MTSKFGLGDLAASGLSKVGVGPLNVGNVLDTVEFVKKAWSAFGVPSSLAPTADLGELDRRISDLKAVEQWLTVNMSMLQGTIQALEIQRGTIATLEAYGSALSSPAAGAQAFANLLSAAATPDRTTAEKVPHEVAAAANDEARPAHAPAPKSESAHAGAPGTGAGSPKSDAARREPGNSGTAEASAAGSGTAAAATQPGLDPAAWWNLLQGQFNQVATAAMAGVGLSSAGSAAAHDDEPAKATQRGSRRATREADEGAPLARARGRHSPDASAARRRDEGDGAKPRGARRAKAKRPQT